MNKKTINMLIGVLSIAFISIFGYLGYRNSVDNFFVIDDSVFTQDDISSNNIAQDSGDDMDDDTISLGYGWSMQDGGIYLNSDQILDFDIPSFEVINDSFVKDKHGVYYRNNGVYKKLAGVDIGSFSRVNYTIDNTTQNSENFVKDKDGVYYIYENNKDKRVTKLAGVLIDSFSIDASGEPRVDGDSLLKSKTSTSKCLLDICVPDFLKEVDQSMVDESIYRGDDYEYYKFSYDAQAYEIFYVYKKDKYIEIISGGYNSGLKNNTLAKIGDMYLHRELTKDSDITSIDQIFLDKDGNTLDSFDLDGLSDLSISIGNLGFDLKTTFSIQIQNDEFHETNFKYLSTNKLDMFDGGYIDSIDVVPSVIYNYILENKIFFPNYLFNLEKYPNILFMYSTSDAGFSYRLVRLMFSPSQLLVNIKEDGDFINLELTNTILSYFQDRDVIKYDVGVRDELGELIMGVDSYEELPIFKVQRLDGDDNYMVYPASGYSIY